MLGLFFLYLWLQTFKIQDKSSSSQVISLKIKSNQNQIKILEQANFSRLY